jgi:hypothetical protein
MKTGESFEMNKKENGKAMARSWLIVLSLALFFFLWGLLIYFSVGVSWPPPWRYGTIPDVPGESLYSVRGAEERAGRVFPPGEETRVQSVMGDRKNVTEGEKGK